VQTRSTDSAGYYLLNHNNAEEGKIMKRELTQKVSVNKFPLARLLAKTDVSSIVISAHTQLGISGDNVSARGHC
jgi:hypothetical protein